MHTFTNSKGAIAKLQLAISVLRKYTLLLEGLLTVRNLKTWIRPPKDQKFWIFLKKKMSKMPIFREKNYAVTHISSLFLPTPFHLLQPVSMVQNLGSYKQDWMILDSLAICNIRNPSLNLFLWLGSTSLHELSLNSTVQKHSSFQPNYLNLNHLKGIHTWKKDSDKSQVTAPIPILKIN